MQKIRTALGVIKNFQNWSTFFADYFKLIKNKYVVYKLRNGIKYKTRSGTVDKNIINESWLYRVYTPKGFEIHENDVVFDIGAHIGAFSIFASQYAKNGKIFSFEPVPENFEMLKKNTLLNNLDNITLINKAVFNKNGNKTIFLNNNNAGRHSLYFHKKNSASIKVKTTSLDNFILKNKIKHINFLKMDCEGAEFQILFGCSKDTLKKIQKISMEYHNVDEKNNVEALRKFLEKNGFKVTTRADNYSMLYAVKY